MYTCVLEPLEDSIVGQYMHAYIHIIILSGSELQGCSSAADSVSAIAQHEHDTSPGLTGRLFGVLFTRSALPLRHDDQHARAPQPPLPAPPVSSVPCRLRLQARGMCARIRYDPLTMKACLLLSLEQIYPPAFQLALDMFKVLKLVLIAHY